MKPEHTPGPWKACRSCENYNGLYYELEPNTVLSEIPWDLIDSETGPIIVASGLKDPTDADMHLIAAAPTLYEACCAALALLEDPEADAFSASKVGRTLEEALAICTTEQKERNPK